MRPEGLTIVATPIGNLADISLRAIEVLRQVDVVVCEDTRVTRTLLDAYDLSVTLWTYHEHNADQQRPKLMKHLESGKTLALVSDAGMPLISDPGYKLVRDALDAGLPVTAVPGASASLTALVLSGLPSDRFFFAGFLPAKQAARRKALDEYQAIPGSLLFYESAKRLAASLQDMAESLGPRPACVARELTKRFEELRRGALPDLAEHYKTHGPPKGEVVIVVGPAETHSASDAEVEASLVAALETASLRDAVAEVTEQTGRPRNEVYQMALQLKKRPADP